MDSKFPAVGELVIGNCSKVTPHGAYFEIFDYESLGKEAGFVHISELSRTWVRNIRSQVREEQRVVAKILRVDERRGEIDMSIRRVSEPQRRSKMTDLKLENRARGIVKIACEKTESDLESVEKILIAEYGSIYEALLALREKNAKFLTKIKIKADISEVLYDIAVKALQPPTVRLQGEITLTCYESDGAIILSEFFKKYTKEFKKKHKGSEINLQIISPPIYRCIVESPDWKTAESDWKGIQKEFHDSLKSSDVEMSFERK